MTGCIPTHSLNRLNFIHSRVHNHPLFAFSLSRVFSPRVPVIYLSDRRRLRRPFYRSDYIIIKYIMRAA